MICGEIRFRAYYGQDKKRELSDDMIPALRKKWRSLSEFVKEIKQGFSRFYKGSDFPITGVLSMKMAG